MTNLAAIIVETFTMGTLTGDVFVELQNIFQNVASDMGATSISHISVRALQILTDRGFVQTSYDYKGHANGVIPSERAQAYMYLELASGGRCMEPRDAFDARLVVRRPMWCEGASGLGVSASA
jgi:hypothetical protein